MFKEFSEYIKYIDILYIPIWVYRQTWYEIDKLEK